MSDSGRGVCDAALSADGNFPKPLLKVREKTILDWLLEDIHTQRRWWMNTW